MLILWFSLNISLIIRKGPPGKHKPHMWCDVWDGAFALQPHSHTRTLTITCTCCYDEINGIQDLKIHSHADSMILSQYLMLVPCCFWYNTICPCFPGCHTAGTLHLVLIRIGRRHQPRRQDLSCGVAWEVWFGRWL